MQELFLSAYVANDQRVNSAQVLNGYCGMSPVYFLRRRLLWEGSRDRTMGGIDSRFIAQQPPAKAQLWRGLHEQLVRQPYILTLLYDVKHSDFAVPALVGGENRPALDGP